MVCAWIGARHLARSIETVVEVVAPADALTLCSNAQDPIIVRLGQYTSIVTVPGSTPVEHEMPRLVGGDAMLAEPAIRRRLSLPPLGHHQGLSLGQQSSPSPTWRATKKWRQRLARHLRQEQRRQAQDETLHWEHSFFHQGRMESGTGLTTSGCPD